MPFPRPRGGPSSPGMARRKKSDKGPNAIDLLTGQHREVEKLFGDLESAADGARKEQLFTQLADKLAIHAKIEELHFYPGSKDDDTEDDLKEAVQEHLGIK